MKIALTILHYFPYGGMQRDLFAIAQACANSGYGVRIFAESWQGPHPAGCEVECLPSPGRFKALRAHRFALAAEARVAQWEADLVLGFDLMPGLDVYFAAAPCFLESVHAERSPLYRLTPGYRHRSRLEAAVFGEPSQTRILLPDPRQEPVFRRWYDTPAGRFVHLPPGVAEDRRAGGDAGELRAQGRAEFELDDSTQLLLLMGSNLLRKGCDRALKAFAALPAHRRSRARMLVVGADDPQSMRRLAGRLGVGADVTFTGARDDVPRLLQAADLLLHPARTSKAGAVLLEALVAGLPVLTTATCGYALKVDAAGAGVVLREPFKQAALDLALARMLDDNLGAYRRRGLAYAARHDLHGQRRRVLAEIDGLIEGMNAGLIRSARARAEEAPVSDAGARP
ncbi:MAG: glycosyltransferase family 4 protein [Gammaproteobacteria bacterium]|nr:glycosyltransferase family 4 protein [Gammaproteobacteria bacterium]